MGFLGRGTILASGTKIAIIGLGSMGGALAEGIIKNGVARACDVSVSNRGKQENLARISELGAEVCSSNEEAVRTADAVLLCVKKDDMGALLSEIGSHLAGRTVIFVAAGETISHVESMASYAGVVSAMAGLEGVKSNLARSGLCFGKSASERDKRIAEGIFGSFGRVEWISENGRAAFTALAASMEAIAADFADRLSDAAAKLGICKEYAEELISQAFMASGAARLAGNQTALQISSEVACKGGLADAAKKRAEELGLGSISEAIVQAMFFRGKEMEQK
ncbi:MAG: NAD(P)-binding domain-containing protein [Candidatus Anstonellaceae archaeon]